MRLKAIGKWMAAAGAVIALTAFSAVPAFAATISQVKLTFTSSYEDPGVIEEPTVTANTYGLEVESVEWSKDVEKWKPGNKVTATVRLCTTGARELAASYGKKTCIVSGATYKKAEKSGDEYLIVTAEYYPIVWLESPEEAGWSVSNRTRAVWKKVDYATGYQIRLYRDDSYIKTIDVTGTSKDLSEYMGSEGNYYYEVRAVGHTTNDAKYRISSEYITSTDHLLDDLGDTDGEWKNYENGKKYISDTGVTVTSQWYQISGNWYYFDENGFAVTGWRKVDGKWYYLESDGRMAMGWKQVGGIWYYLNDSGDMATGWKQTNPGTWYYLNADGSMATNTVVDGCSIDASGVYVAK